MPIVASVCALVAALAAVGTYWGFENPRSYLAFWTLTGLTLFTARQLVHHVSPRTAVDKSISIAIVSLGIIVGSGLLLGSIGRLRVLDLLLLQTMVCVGAIRSAEAFALRRSAEAVAVQEDDRFSPPPWVVGIAGALVACAAGFGIAHLSAPLYDSLSYHLFFAARWVQEHAISIIPTPFSDPAQAYAPANGEVYFAWLMLPFHGDLLARIGQLPFAILGSVTLYALARRLGAQPAHAIYPAVFFLLSRPILEQTLGANVDLICATLFLTSLYLGLVAAERHRAADWALWGISVGLYAGSKYLALVYLPVLALIPILAKPPRVRLWWALPGIAAFALPWYLRNWIVGGSPIYPASLSVAGFTLVRGAFNRTAMLNSVFHTTNPRLLPAMAAHALGPTLFFVWIPVAIVGGIGLLRGMPGLKTRPTTDVGRVLSDPPHILLSDSPHILLSDPPHILVFLAPFLMVPLYWFGLPVNVDSRFLMPAVAPALVPFAFTFNRNRTWNGIVHAAYTAAMLWIAVGSQREVPASLPWFMRGWLSLAGLIKPEFIWWFGGLAIAMTTLWWTVSRRPRWAMSAAVVSIAASATVLAIGGERWCVPSRCEYLEATSPHIGMDLVYGWRWLGDHATHSTVAYTGINLPYPLTGPQLTNRVVYVNIAGNPAWRFHDYDHAVRAGRFHPLGPTLATASGELRPVPLNAAFSGAAARPRWERMEGARDIWVDNLKRLRADFLFVSALSPYEVDNVWHTDRGFPIEDAWASADPQGFRLAYENPAVRIFAVENSAASAKATAAHRSFQRRWEDAQ